MDQDLVVMDVGACSLKIGHHNYIRTIPNCIFKSRVERRKSAFISSQIEACKDHSGLYYTLPFQRGYLVNWDVQRQIWDHAFGRVEMNISPLKTSLILTEPHFNFPTIQEGINELFFEEYEFQSILRTNASTLSCRKYEEQFPREDCCVIVDAGYSFTHIVPYHGGKKLSAAIIRIDIGGKVLTNHLKEIISYRQLQVMDETYVMNQVKEDACYVSMDFVKDMGSARVKGDTNPLLCEYVLPDYSSIHRGYIKKNNRSNRDAKQDEQIIHLAGERVSVPEILFHPSDIGIPQMGIPEAIVHSISKCPKELQPNFYRNILLTGGSCRFPNFKERLEKDVRSVAPCSYKVRIYKPERLVEHILRWFCHAADLLVPSVNVFSTVIFIISLRPDEYACSGGMAWSKQDNFREHFLTLEEYQEAGQSACLRQFIGI